MAAGKDETEAVVLDFLILVRRLPDARVVDTRLGVEREVFLCAVEARPPAHSGYGFEARGGNKPGARFIRYAGLRPRVQSSGKGLVHGLFGDIKISEQARQRSKNPARFAPVKRLYDSAELFGNILRHARQTNKRWCISIGPRERAFIYLRVTMAGQKSEPPCCKS
jgi:hypothetical protein